MTTRPDLFQRLCNLSRLLGRSWTIDGITRTVRTVDAFNERVTWLDATGRESAPMPIKVPPGGGARVNVKYLLRCSTGAFLVGDGRIVGAYLWTDRARAERYEQVDALAIVASIVSRHPTAKIKPVPVFA